MGSSRRRRPFPPLLPTTPPHHGPQRCSTCSGSQCAAQAPCDCNHRRLERDREAARARRARQSDEQADRVRHAQTTVRSCSAEASTPACLTLSCPPRLQAERDEALSALRTPQPKERLFRPQEAARRGRRASGGRHQLCTLLTRLRSGGYADGSMPPLDATGEFQLTLTTCCCCATRAICRQRSSAALPLRPSDGCNLQSTGSTR